MRLPEGKDFWGRGFYREIAQDKKIVNIDSFADPDGNIVPASCYGMEGEWPLELFVTVTFEKLEDGRTKQLLQHLGYPDGTGKDLAKEGWNQSFDKFAEMLERDRIAMKGTKFEYPSDKEVVMLHIFEAPPDVVFEIYSDPKLIPEWWGPADLKTNVETDERRVGGKWRYVQVDYEGNVYAFNGTYKDITPPMLVSRIFEYEGMPRHIVIETMKFDFLDGRT